MPVKKDLTLAKRRAAAQLTGGLRGIVVFLFLISGLINILALTGSFYMLQIYDRALTSGSVPTLVALSVLALGLYLFQGVFDVIRIAGPGPGRRPLRQEDRRRWRTGWRSTCRASAFRRRRRSSAAATSRRVRGFLGGQGPIRLVRPAVDPALSRLRLPAAPLARRADLRGRVRSHGSHHRRRSADPPSRRRRASRHNRPQHDRRFERAQRRRAQGDGIRRRRGPALSGRQQRASRPADPHQRRRPGRLRRISRVLRMLLQSAVLGLGAYPDDQGRPLSRRDHRLLGRGRTRAGSGRHRDRQLEVVRGGPPRLSPAARRRWRRSQPRSSR